MSKQSALEKPSRTLSKLKIDSHSIRISAMPPGVNSLDHSIYRQNGSTSAIEFTANRLQSAKFEVVPDPMTRIEELTREMGYLRQEIHFYRQCFEILHRLRESSYDIYQQLFLESYFPPTADRLQELTIQLHRGLEDSMKREATAEKEWKAFWGYDSNTEEWKGDMI